jgi:hypothetical protein
MNVVLIILGHRSGNGIDFASIKKLTNSTAQITLSSLVIFNTILSFMLLDLQLHL